MARLSGTLVVLVTACGRFGFDELPAAADAGNDANPACPFVIGGAKLTAGGVNSYVDLAVDWTNGLAYTASRKSDECVAVIDLADESAPRLLAEIDPPMTLGGACLGVEIFEGGQKLLLASEASNRVELWDLGADPRAMMYSRLRDYAASQPRRMRLLPASPGYRLHFVESNLGVSLWDISADWIVSPGATYAQGCVDRWNDLAVTTNHVLSGCASDASPIVVLDRATMGLAQTIDMDNGGLSGFWSAASLGDTVFMGGWVSGFVDTATSPVALRSRFDNDGTYRAATLVDDGGPRVYAVRGDLQWLEVIDASDVTSPTVIARADLGCAAATELYGIEVDVARRRGVVVSNDGDVVVVDLDALPAASIVWPAF